MPQSKIIVLAFVSLLLYSLVSIEQVVCFLPFVSLTKRLSLNSKYLYNALLILAIVQIIQFEVHSLIVNSVVLLAALQNVDSMANHDAIA